MRAEAQPRPTEERAREIADLQRQHELWKRDMEVRADLASQQRYNVVMPPLFELETGPDGRVYATDPNARAIALPVHGGPEPAAASERAEEDEPAPQSRDADEPEASSETTASSSMIAARRFISDDAPPVGVHLDDSI